MENDFLKTKLLSEPCYIDKHNLSNILISSELTPQAVASQPDAEAREGRLESFTRRKEDGEQIGRYTTVRKDGIAVVNLEGPVIKNVNWDFLYDYFPTFADSVKVVDADIVVPEMQELAKNEDVRGVIFNVNSPGGMVVGTKEMGEAIAGVTATKPTVGTTEMMAASAGYWMLSQAGYIVATDTARVGSIGVYMALLDDSEWLEKMGLKLEVIKSGKLKAIGLGSLTDEQRNFLQAGVIEMHEEFRQIVREGRGQDISDNLMEGQALPAQKVVGTLVDETALNPMERATELINQFA